MKSKLLFPLFALLFSFTSFAQIGIGQPVDLFECDSFGNGFAQFDLTSNDASVLSNLDPAGYTVSYYASLAEAENNINPLSSPYLNTSNPQTIFVRVFEFATGNFELASFEIFAESPPIPTLQTIYEVCDGSEVAVESGLSAQDFDFIWYLDGILLQNEDNASLVTSMPGQYSLQIISANGCSSFTDFQVIIGSLDNIMTPTPFVVCDDDGDGFALFNLDTKTQEIVNGLQNPTVALSYHETIADADNGVNAINPLYTNTLAFNQTLFVRIFSIQGDCVGITSLDLVVDIDCVSVSAVEAFVCADDFNTTVIYDLTLNEAEIVNGQDPAGFSFSYYSNLTSAENQTNPAVNPEAYAVLGNSTVVYVRVEDNQTGNATIVEIFINYVLNPQVDFNGPYTICNGQEIVLIPAIIDNQQYSYLWSTGETSPEIVVSNAGTYTLTVTDIFSGCSASASTEVVLGGNAPVLANAANLFTCVPNSSFDLTAALPEILNGQDPNLFIISFFDDANSAFSNTNAIFDPTTFLALDPLETIFVRVQNNDDACFAIAEFIITTDNSCPEVIDCSQPINNSFCYASMQVNEFSYESSDDSRLVVFFNAGQVEVNFDALVVLDSDGVTNLNPVETTYGNNGDLTGLSFTSTGNSIVVRIDADDSISCFNQNYDPIDYDVSCFDPDAVPGCSSILTLPENGADNVNEFTDLSWTPSSGVVNGYKLSVGITSGGTEIIDNEDVGNVLTYGLDTLEYEVTYYLTIVPYNDNGDAENCQEFSFTTRANPNQIVVCEDGVVNTTYCYENNDDTEFSFQSSDGLPLTLVFNAGGTETNFDEILILDSEGTVLNPDLPYGNGGDFTGLTYTSSGSSITVRFDTDGSISCANGSGCCAVPFDFDVFCTSSVGIIEVNAFVDANANTIFDPNEFSFSNGYFTYEVNGDGNINTVNSSTGSFQIISENDTDTYEITFNLYEESAGCYDVTTSSFSNVSVTEGNTVTIDFPVVEEQSCEDLAVYLINYWTPPRPGFSHENHLVIENLGFTTIASGTVEYVVDAQLIFNSVTSLNPNYTITTTSTGFTVDFVNLQPGDSEFIDISLTCPVTLELGEIVTNTALYVTDSNDLVASNNLSNLSEIVVGSWDPNDKMEARGPRVLFDDFVVSDQWLYYTIRFQNLGTFPATFVRIEDELDAQLDETTFQMLRSSDDYVVTRTESSLEWFFDDINLPAAQDDEEGSQGFVYFRIKPKAGYALGDIIPNTAAIFFDFNAPVITNRFETEFVEETLSVSEFDSNGFNMYPNPANNVLHIKLNNITNANLSIYDIQGKLVLERKMMQEQNLELNVSELQSGLYFVKLNTRSQELVKKLIIE